MNLPKQLQASYPVKAKDTRKPKTKETKTHAKAQSRKGKTEKRFQFSLWFQTLAFSVSLW
jgi:hypothetical protein